MPDIGHSLGVVLAAAARRHEPFPGWVPLVVAGMWLLTTTLLAMISGHMALLSRFPPVDERTPERFSFASGTMRGVSYRSALHVAIGSRQGERGGWIPRCSRFEVPRIGLRFEVCGTPGLAVESALARIGGGAQV